MTSLWHLQIHRVYLCPQVIYLFAVLPLTTTLSAVAGLPGLPLPMGLAIAESEIEPRLDGAHLHVAVMLGDIPVVATPIQPGIRLPFAVKVILEATSTFATRLITDLYVAVVAFPARAIELKETGIP